MNIAQVSYTQNGKAWLDDIIIPDHLFPQGNSTHIQLVLKRRYGSYDDFIILKWYDI